MTTVLDVSIIIDDATPDTATIVVNGVSMTWVSLGSGAGITGVDITQIQVWQTHAGLLSRGLQDAMETFFAADESLFAETGAGIIGSNIWNEIPIDSPFNESLYPVGYFSSPLLNPFALFIRKTSPAAVYSVGDTVTWDLELTNGTGQDLSTVEINGIVAGGLGSLSLTPIATTINDGISATTTASYTLVAGDDAGALPVAFSAAGVDVSSLEYTTAAGPFSINQTLVATDVAVSVLETSTGPYVPGDDVVWDVDYINQSGQPLLNVNIQASHDGSGSLVVGGGLFDMAVGETVTALVTYTSTAADESATVTLIVEANGQKADSVGVQFLAGDATVAIGAAPIGLDLAIIIPPGPYTAGDTIYFSGSLTNTSGQALTNVTVEFSTDGGGSFTAVSPVSLAIGASTGVSFDYVSVVGEAASTVNVTWRSVGTLPSTSLTYSTLVSTGLVFT